MRRHGLLSAAILAIAAASAAEDLDQALSFEGDHGGVLPKVWWANVRDTVHLETEDARGGKWCARLQRDAKSDGRFTAISVSVPARFKGDRIELRGQLKTEGVTGYAGLWIRQDGADGQLALDNMRDRQLRGDSAWTEYRIAMEVRAGLETLVVGALLVGEGRVWVDELRLFVDGKPLRAQTAGDEADAGRTPVGEFDKGSKITVAALSAVQVRNVTLLGKVWGFLKYHHPRVASTDLDWDAELFRALPAVLAAVDAPEGNAAVLRLRARIGSAPDRAARLEAGDVHLNAPVDWIRDAEELGRDLNSWLVETYTRRHQGKQRYVSLVRSPNPLFRNEAAYGRFPCPDAGYRILAVCRFWNIIRYWFPYRDVIGEDWDGVLTEFLPRIVAASTADAYRLELMALVARVHDTHANLWSSLDVRPPRGTATLPVQVRFVDGKAVVTRRLVEGGDPGLRRGDVIVSLDGERVSDLVLRWAPLYAASNEAARLRDIGRSLPRGDPGPCRVAIERDGVARELVVMRVPSDGVRARTRFTHDRPGPAFQLLSPDVAYLKLSAVKNAEIDDYLRRAKDTRGLVIDIRNYPSEFVVWTLAPRLVRKRTEFVRFTRADIDNPGRFLWGEAFALEPKEPGYAGKVVVLVDETSQSQAEYTAMALRAAPGAVVVGSTTAGADGNVSVIPLPGGLRSLISGLGVFYPDRKPTQRIGIVPDVVARPTIAGIRAGRDEVLETAIRRIVDTSVSDSDVVRMARHESSD